MATDAASTGGVVEDYALALFAVARGEGILEIVEDELYRVARTFETSDELRSNLANELIPVGTREGIVEELLGAQGATTVTRAIVDLIVAAGRASQLPAIVDAFVDAAAASRQHVVAQVRSAVPLDDDVQGKLGEALSKATRKNVEVKVIVDPSVVGGLVAQVGDQVIDGTVRSKLNELRENL